MFAMDEIEELIFNIKNRTLTDETLSSGFYHLYSLDEKLPQLLPPKEYAKVKGMAIYRGFDCDKLSFCKYVYDFAKGEFQRVHKAAALGNGIYFATKKYYANYYTRLSRLNSFFGVNILSGKVGKDARLTSPKILNHEFFRDQNKIIKTLNQKFDGLLTQIDLDYLYFFMHKQGDYMVKAVTLGYDALVRQTPKNNGQIVVVYNRDKIVLSQKVSEIFIPSLEK